MRELARFSGGARPAATVLAAVLALSGCLDIGGAPRTGVFGRATAGPGLVFFEMGHVQQGEFQKFTLLDEDGHFEVDLPAPGPWGVHLYLDDFFYLPLEVQVEEGHMTQVLQADIDWATIRKGPAWGSSGSQPEDAALLAIIPDPDLTENPILARASVERVGEGLFAATVNIEDPSGNLSRQTLLGHAQTHRGVQLNAPAPPVNDVFPDGDYTTRLYMDDDTGTNGDWWFIAADHNCENSPLTRVRAE